MPEGKMRHPHRRDDAGPHEDRRACCPSRMDISYDLCNKLMTKREISKMIDAVYRHCGQKESVIFCDRIMGLGFYNAYKAGISFGKDDMVIPPTKEKLVNETRELAKEYEQQYIDGLITQGEKYNKVVDAWAKCTDRVAEEMMKKISAVADRQGDRPREADQLDLHDEPLGRPRLAGADEAARRHARPHGQAVGRDHRNADHLELQGRPVRSRILQLDPRRPQGSRRYRAEDGQLRLSDPPSRRRGPGRDHLGRGLRHQGGDHRPADHRCRRSHRFARQSRSRPHRCDRR